MPGGLLTYFLSDEARQNGVTFEAPRSGDAGYDLRAAGNQVIEPGKQLAVPTGLKLAIPHHWVGLIRDRSSMASKRIYSHAGVIDAGYRGEVKVLLSNNSDESYHIEAGDKIAQLVVVPHLSGAEAVESETSLGSTERGDGGFGSTGR